LGKPRKRRTSEEATNSSLVGPEDPERGNPPPHTEKDEQSQCKSSEHFGCKPFSTSIKSLPKGN
jgi:hypothetical protein